MDSPVWPVHEHNNNSENGIRLLDQIIRECSNPEGYSTVLHLLDLGIHLNTLLNSKISIPLSRLKDALDSSFADLEKLHFTSDKSEEIKRIFARIIKLSMLVRQLLQNSNSTLHQLLTHLCEFDAAIAAEISVIRAQIESNPGLKTLTIAPIPTNVNVQAHLQVLNELLEKFVNEFINEEERAEISRSIALCMANFEKAQEIGKQHDGINSLLWKIQLMIYSILNNNSDNSKRPFIVASALFDHPTFLRNSHFESVLTQTANDAFTRFID